MEIEEVVPWGDRRFMPKKLAASSVSASVFLLGDVTPLRIADQATCCAGHQWATPAEHTFMDGVGSVMYGGTFTVEGGTPWLYRTNGLPMFAVEMEGALNVRQE
jgi:hypothetical protein